MLNTRFSPWQSRCRVLTFPNLDRTLSGADTFLAETRSIGNAAPACDIFLVKLSGAASFCLVVRWISY